MEENFNDAFWSGFSEAIAAWAIIIVVLALLLFVVIYCSQRINKK